MVRTNYTKDAKYAAIRTTVPGARQLAALASPVVMRVVLGSALVVEEGHLACAAGMLRIIRGWGHVH